MAERSDSGPFNQEPPRSTRQLQSPESRALPSAGAPADGSARLSGDCNWRVLRGGSWLNGPESLRSATRFRTSSEERAYYINGFRVALTLDP